MINKYHQKHKEILRKEALGIYQNLSEEKNEKRQKKLEKDIKILLKKKKKKRNHYYQECKRKLPDYRRNYYLTHKK